MKNKKRLAVLAMSAVMAMTSMPFSAFAADFSAGEGVTDAVVEETADAAEEALDVEDETADDVSATAVNARLVEWSSLDEGNDGFTAAELSAIKDGTTPLVVKYNSLSYKVSDYKVLSESTKCGEQGTVALAVTIDGVTCWSDDDTLTIKYIYKTAAKWAEHDWKYKDAYTKTPATCTTPGEVITIYKCANCGEEKEVPEEKDIDVQNHKWSTDKLNYVGVYGTYLSNGKYVTVTKEAAVEAAKKSNLKYSEKTVTLGNGNTLTFLVVDTQDGNPVLDDISVGGKYMTGRYCTYDGALEDPQSKPVEPEAVKALYARVIEKSKEIKTSVEDLNKLAKNGSSFLTSELPIDEDDIELVDCSKGGTYTVAYYSGDSKVGTKTINVSAHHYQVYKTAVFASKNDAAQCTVKTEKDGSLTVTNKSCYLPVDYEEVTHCSAEGCKLDKHVVKSTSVEKDGTDTQITTHKGAGTYVTTTSKTADPAGDHAICTEAKRQVYEAVNAKDSLGHTILTGHKLYDKLVEIAEDIKTNGCEKQHKGEYVTVSAAPACEKGGYVTVSYICVVDKKTVAETEQVYIAPDEHVGKEAVIENEVAPTCSAMGTYDAVTYCKYCGTEMKREAKKIQRLAHTNEYSVKPNGEGVDKIDDITNAYIFFRGEQVVDYDGDLLTSYETDKNKDVSTLLETAQRKYVGGNSTIGTTTDKAFKYEYAVVAELRTNCTVCGNHEVVLSDGTTEASDKKLQQAIKIQIVSIEKQNANGTPGSITLKATYTDANGKVITGEKTVDYYSTIEAYASRVVSPTKTGINLDSDGVYRYYVNGEFQKDYDGIQAYGGEKFIVVDGIIPVTDKKATGLCKWIDGVWYFVHNGRIRSDYTGIVNHDGEMFYVTNGILDTSITDLVDYYGATVLFTDGRKRNDVSGLWQDPDGTWWYLRSGQVQTWLTGEYTVGGRTVTVEGGMVVKG